MSALGSRWGMSIGEGVVPWVVAGYGPYRHEDIECHFNPTEPTYPDDVASFVADVRRDLAQRAARGEDVAFDSKTYKLARFHVSSRTGDTEEPRLVLHFAPSTYYRMLATDRRLDVEYTAGGTTQTLRERYARDVDLRVAPVPEFATFWNVGLSVVTADRYLLISQRGRTAVDPDVYGPAVAEGVSPVKDANAHGAPDHWFTAARGMDEELGVPLDRNELVWLSLGANAKLCQYALIGCVFTRFSLSEIEGRRSVGTKDAWETRNLHAVEFDPQAVAEFCTQDERRFTPFAVAALTHSLIFEFGARDTIAALRSRRVRSSQNLPGWL